MAISDHSIWLMPSSDDERRLALRVAQIAAEFGTPVFQPHLILVEDMERPSEELLPLMQELCEGCMSFDAPIVGVEMSDLFFRSLYVRFIEQPELIILKRASISLFHKGDIDRFMPHVSLGYGIGKSFRKSLVLEELSGELSKTTIRFDRIAIVNSSQRVPIDEWRVVSFAWLRKRERND